jgi:hypothetical protein
MADSTTEIDLDSVIDRLLEGQFYLFPPFPLLSSCKLRKTPTTRMGMDYALALPRFVVCLVLVVAPCPRPLNSSATGLYLPRASRQSAEENIFKNALS